MLTSDGRFTISVCLLFIAASMSSCSLSRKLLYFPKHVPKQRLEYLGAKYKHVREITITAKDGTKLHGWFIDKNFQNYPQHYPTIVYFGGNGEEVSSNIESFEAGLEANVVLVNYRGYGLSQGRPNETNLYSDAEEIYEYVAKTFEEDKNQIIVFGRSLGAGVAVRLAAQKDINNVVLITPYDSIENVARSSFPDFLVTLFLTDKFQAIDDAPRIKGKVLIIAAGKDEIIPPRHAQLLYEALTCKKEITTIEGANHNNIVLFTEYWQELNGFISAWKT